MTPTIQHMRNEGSFKYLWLKYVTDVRLDVHCAKCLVGEYSKMLYPKLSQILHLSLNEHNAKWYYLCGVSSPYRWENNFHLAFRYAKGKTFAVRRNGIYINILDAEEIIIRPTTGPQPYIAMKPYNTCRNWQFACMVANQEV